MQLIFHIKRLADMELTLRLERCQFNPANHFTCAQKYDLVWLRALFFFRSSFSCLGRVLLHLISPFWTSGSSPARLVHPRGCWGRPHGSVLQVQICRHPRPPKLEQLEVLVVALQLSLNTTLAGSVWVGALSNLYPSSSSWVAVAKQRWFAHQARSWPYWISLSGHMPVEGLSASATPIQSSPAWCESSRCWDVSSRAAWLAVSRWRAGRPLSWLLVLSGALAGRCCPWCTVLPSSEANSVEVCCPLKADVILWSSRVPAPISWCVDSLST